MRFTHFTGAAACALLTLFVAREAAADTCDNLTTEPDNTVPILYIENGDTQEPLLKRIGKQLMQTAGAKVRIVYRNRPTCDLATNFYGARTLTTVASRPIRYIPADPAFDPATSTSPTCDAPTTAPTIQLAIGATFLSSCGTAVTSMQPTDTTVVNGPNQAYGFIVNNGSSQVAILAEEGYLAYGYTAGGGMATPWIDQSLRFTRGATASTNLTMSANIGLTPAQMLIGASLPAGNTASADILAGVIAAADVQAAIGALGGDLYDANRDKVKILAFKAFNQRFAYYPDKTSATFDKQNVRDGHYLPWSPTQYIFAHTTGTTTPADATVARFMGLIFGPNEETDVNGLTAVAQSGLIPQCAMKVQRSFDGGDLSLFDSPTPCGCFYEKSVPSGATACTACSTATPCSSGTCRLGYCEAK